MLRKAITEAIQNKNSVMFITSLIFMAGILSYFNDNALICSAILTIAAIIGILKNYISPKLILFWAFIFYFGFFNSYLRIHTTDSLLPIAPNEMNLTGQIITIPNSNSSNKTKFFFKVNKADGKEISAKTFVTVKDENGDFSKYNIGDFYELKGKLRLPFKASNPSQFDYGKYLRNFDTFTVIYTTNDDSKFVKAKLTPKWAFLQNLNNLRNKIITTHSGYLKSPNLEILGGIVFGDDAVAPPDYIKASFVNSGLLHILAASGMNVAFIYGFWYFILRRLRVPFKLTVISGMGVVVIYTLMTGLGPSVIRAALMLIIILIGKLIDRDAHSVSLLALVAMLMLIYNPAYINDVGFQLSFLVTFGLLTTGSIIFERLKDTKIPNWLSGSLLIPIIAQVWVAPIQMFYFNTFSLYSVFANVLSVPFLSVISFGGFVGSIFAIFMPYTKYICMPIDFVLNFILNILVWISNFFAHLPHSMLTTTHPNLIQIFFYYVIVMIITLMIKNGFNKKALITCSFIIIGLLISTIHFSNGRLEVIAFDVQNADCFLVKTPSDKYFIIDTGRPGYKGGKSQAEMILLKYLKDRGLKNIEGLIVTHFDSDHAGGTNDIINKLNVKTVYLNSLNDKSPTAKYIYKNINTNHQTVKTAKNNNIIYKEKDFTVKTYYADFAPKRFKFESQHDNENSIITLISFKDFDMLFMGDAGVAAYDKVKKDIPHNIEILKAGHHGGPRVVNDKMLSDIKSEVSIISTGINNFGHPNKATLDILRDTDIYRTDRHNSIKITTKGRKYSVLNYSTEKHQYVINKNYTAINQNKVKN